MFASPHVFAIYAHEKKNRIYLFIIYIRGRLNFAENHDHIRFRAYFHWYLGHNDYDDRKKKSKVFSCSFLVSAIKLALVLVVYNSFLVY